MPQLRVTCFASGNGSNFQSLLDASLSGTLPENTRITRLICNRKDAFVRERAKKAGIPDIYHNLYSGNYTKRFPGESKGASRAAREAYDADLASIAMQDSPSLIVCAGWMHVLSSAFLDPVARAGIDVINLHPALPGEFNGSNAIQRAYDAFRRGELKRTGIMIHRVIQEVDMGQPILIEAIDCKEGESLQELEDRMHLVEHRLIVAGTKLAIDDLNQRG